MWTTIALLAALGGTPGQTDLALTHVRSTHGLLGPERKNESVSPGDVLFLCFDIEGIKVDDDGKVQYSMALELKDERGKVLFKQLPKDLEAKTSLGGVSVPAYATLNVGLETPPGDYQFKITVKDRASGKEQSLSRKFKVLPKDFALVRTQTSLDTDGQYPAAVFASGQGAWVHCSAVGFERGGAGKQPNIVFEMRVLDDTGKPTLARPVTSTIDKGIPADKVAVPMAFPLSLNRAGKFTIEIAAIDQGSGKKAKMSFPITVQSAQN
ncbi:MAG TPA: hypothetical protein VN688_34305 [Gemmataceae bacterium]|nr:hypothetical protein [Gemmataceae bacterium]